MRKLIISLIVLPLFSIAQIPVYQWGLTYGGLLGENGNSISTDAQGNVIVGGYFSDVVDFDPGPNQYSLSNPYQGNSIGGFVQKLDANGSFLWAVQFSAIQAGPSPTGSALVNSIQTNSNNEIFITGWFNGNIDFDPHPISVNPINSRGTFVLKLNTNGQLQWVSTFEDSNSTSDYGGKDIKIDSNGNIIVLGAFDGNADFDPHPVNTFPISANDPTVYVAKINPAGNLINVTTFGTTLNDKPDDLVLDLQDNFYFGGHSSGGVGGQDYFLVKLDSNLNTLWVKNFSDGFSNLGGPTTSLNLRSNQDLIFTGQFQGSVDFDPNSGSYIINTPSNSNFIVDLDLNGNFKWAKSIIGSLVITSSQIFESNIFFSGDFAGTIDFDPGPFNNSITSYNAIQDAFILQLDSSGLFKNSIRYGSFNGDFPYDIFINNQGSIYSTGEFYFSTSLDPSHSYFFQNNGVSDVFVSKIHLCNTDSVNVNIIGCDSLILPNGYLVSTNSLIVDSLLNVFGCDSLVYYNVTIHLSTIDTINITACDSIEINGTNYSNSGYFSQIYTNVNTCDSILVYNLTINASPTPGLNFTGQINLCTQDSILIFTTPNFDSYQWYLNGNLISGETNDHLIINNPGSIYLMVSNNGCTGTSENITINQIPPVNSFITDTICNNEILLFNGSSIDSAGIYVFQFTSTLGCDSTLTLTIIEDSLTADIYLLTNDSVSTNSIGNYQWLIDGNILPNETSNSIYVSIPGNYQIIVTNNNGCVDTSSILFVNPVGMNFNQGIKTIRISPNPAYEKIEIFISGSQILGYEIIDLTGKTLALGNFHPSGPNPISITHFPPGIYAINTSDGRSIRFIKR